MAVNLDNFDNAFDSGLNEVHGMTSNRSYDKIIDLCRNPKKPSKNNPITLGKLAFVPIADKNIKVIHSIEGVLELMVPVQNPDYDPSDPNSQSTFWRTIQYIPEYNYNSPITPAEKEKLDELRNEMLDYAEDFSQYALNPKKLFFMKGLVVKLQNTAGENLYTDLVEPAIIEHKSAKFPKAWEDLCGVQDGWGKQWRKDLMLQKGDVKNVVVVDTQKADIGYNVGFSYMQNVQSGKVIPADKLEEWMDYDINTIGIDTTKFSIQDIDSAIMTIKKARAINENSATSNLDNGIQSSSTPTGGISADAIGAAPAVEPQPAVNTAPVQTAQPVQQPAQQSGLLTL